jgi:hypothetical protein
MDTAVVTPAATPRREPRQGGGDGIGVVRGKGVRLHTCPRCTRTLPPLTPRTAGSRLCDACAAERHVVVTGRRRRWFS